MYGVPSSLIYTKGEEPVLLLSQQGVHQGDPLGPALFLLVIHTILNDVQAENLEVVILAYLDDVMILGPPLDVLNAFYDLKSSFFSV